MIVLAITVLLAAAGIAVMPCWRYSAGWGYGPGTCIGLLLVGIGISAVVGRVGASDALGERLATSAKPMSAKPTPAKPGFIVEASVIKASIAAPALFTPD